MKTIMKRIAWGIAIIALTSLALILLCHFLIVSNANGKVFSDIEQVTPTEYGLLLGTTPQTRIGRKPNQFFKYRIEAAEQLYKAGKIKKILISGDDNSLDGINEVECMRDTLVSRGIAPTDIFLDGKGYRTLDAVWRAVKLYQAPSFIVISQKFHNERAIYLAEHLNLETSNITGFNAADATSNMAMITYIREYFARVKVFVDIITNKKPISCELSEPTKSTQRHSVIESFLGNPVVINDSVIEQIAVVAQQDDKLSYSDSILQICDVKWRINLIPEGVILFTSVNPDEPRMKQVINYLNGIYGKPYDDEEDFNFKWSSSPDPNDIFKGGSTLVHLRRVRSEVGGTFLMFR